MLNRPGGESKLEGEQPMQQRFVVPKLEWQGIFPPSPETRAWPLSESGTLLKARNSHDIQTDAAVSCSINLNTRSDSLFIFRSNVWYGQILSIRLSKTTLCTRRAYEHNINKPRRGK